MIGLSIKSKGKMAVVVSLTLAMLARVVLAPGLLLHDHGDHGDDGEHGIHAHTVTLDDVCDGHLRAVRHDHHYEDHHDEDIHDENLDDSRHDLDGGEYVDSLLILVSDPAMAAGHPGSVRTVIASIQHPSSRVLPRTMLPSNPMDGARCLPAPSPSAHPMRPVLAIDALLQSSRALLL